MNPLPVPRQLSAADRPRLLSHFLALSAEDRRLRFGTAKNDDAVREYVEGIDFDTDGVFGIHGESLELAGVGHVARFPNAAELGVSVLESHRGLGLGSALFERAHLHASTRFLPVLYMHCLTENRVMMHIARKSGMRIVSESGESDAYLELPRPDAGSAVRELLAERVALFDYAVKAQLAAARRLGDALETAIRDV